MTNDYQKYLGMTQEQSDSSESYRNECLKRNGYYIVENFIPQSQVKSLREKIISIWDIQLKKYGDPLLRQIGDYGVCRAMMDYDQEFLDLLVSESFEQVIKETVGDTAILHLQNGIILFPETKHNQARYHRDFPKNFISSEILSINIFILLDDFTKENGGTYLVPSSHDISSMPSDKFIQENQIQLVAPAGSAIVFDSMLWHKGGSNNTNQLRIGMNNQFSKPFIKQQLNYPEIMKDKVNIESKIAQRLGMWAIPPRSLDEYRVTDPRLRTYRAGQG